MDMTSLQDLFLHELRDLYSAEQQIIEALPKMIEASTSAELKEALREHLDLTREQHVARLEKIFEQLEESPKGKTCLGMEGIIKEGEEIMKQEMEEEAIDAALIGAAQKIEHYEMAGYGTAASYAHLIGFHDINDKLETTLEEEKEADENLSELAESTINVETLEEENETNDEEGADKEEEKV